MAFLDGFGPAHRALFETTAETVRLARGQFLMKRGEPGGDVYVLRSGVLEVVDSRSTPEVILSTLAEGAVVGEMAFVDNSPRSVDVRAGSDAAVLRWTRDDLRSLMVRHPDLAAAFYESVARLASGRVRVLTEGAVAGTYTHGGPTSSDADGVRDWVDRISDRVKLALPSAETALRKDADDIDAIGKVSDVLDTLQAEVDQLFEATTDPVARRFATELLARELHPYLVRSVLGERSIRRPLEVAGSADVLAHVLVDTAGGDGRLGEMIDRWLLDRPTFRALRDLREPLIAGIAEALPKNRNRRVLVLSAGTGSVVAGLCARLDAPTVLGVLDQSRDALAMVDGSDRSHHVEVVPLLDSLTRLAGGRVPTGLPRQDAVVMHNLVEYLPERMAVGLLRTARTMLTDDGLIALATVGPSPDRALLDRLLSWPTIRRSDRALDNLITAARLRTVATAPLRDPARLRLLRRVEGAASDTTSTAIPRLR